MQIDRVVIGGALVLTDTKCAADPADILLEGDSIVAIVPPGSVQAPRRIDAANRLIIPGLINAHTHGHGGLAKGVGDRWSLELLLNAGPWINGGRSDDDRYLSTLLTAVEMIRKGCTACYDLSVMLPVPSAEALQTVARAYSDVGMRAVIAPMVADRSFFQAIPGLLEALPPELRSLTETMRAASPEAITAPIRDAARTWSYPDDRIRLGIAPTIPLHCSPEFLAGCRDLANEFGLPVQLTWPNQRCSAPELSSDTARPSPRTSINSACSGLASALRMPSGLMMPRSSSLLAIAARWRTIRVLTYD